MKSHKPDFNNETEFLTHDPEEEENLAEEDLWFLPGPIEEEPDYLPPGPRADPPEAEIIDGWRMAEAGNAARLARVAGCLGALDERLKRGPEGWRHRLALIEASDLSWIAGDRIGPDRLALWVSMRMSGLQDDATSLSRAGWAVRRLTGGLGPEVDLSAFLDRRDPEILADEAEPFSDRAGGWLEHVKQAADLHPITLSCMGFHLWNFAGLGRERSQVEAAVTAGRIAASEHKGVIFAPLAMGGGGGLRPNGGPAADRLARWLDGMENGCLAAMRRLDDIEAWSARAEAEMTALSGKTPTALRAVLTEWPVVSASMAETLTGSSRAAVQRNLIWMEACGLIQEITGQGRYRLWRVSG